MVTGLSWGCVQGILERAVDRGQDRRTLDDIEKVGLDEKNFGRGQD